MFLVVFLVICLWGFLGRVLPLRKFYIILLIRLFEFGSSVVGEQWRKKNVANDQGDTSKSSDSGVTQNGTIEGSVRGTATQNNHTSSVITREFQLSAPDQTDPDAKSTTTKVTDDNLETETVDDETTHNELDFQLASCFDYIKAGMEAIIEDEVTSRFEAEELKNWNLLTRTNR